MHNYLGSIINWIKVLQRSSKLKSYPEEVNEFKLDEDMDFCHKETVHIFVRGLADGRIHSAKNRVYSDVRFYKKNDLKVFCAVCRKKII